MSDNDLEEQRNELLALNEILGKDIVKIYAKSPEAAQQEFDYEINTKFFDQFHNAKDSVIGGSIDISPSIESDLQVIWNGNQSFMISELPAITLNFVFPTNYPSESCPKFNLSCDYLDQPSLNKFKTHFQQLWEDYGGSSVILFIWISAIKDEFLTLLDIEYLDLDPVIKHNKNQGNIQKYNNLRGFGFISNSSTNEKIFFHVSQIRFPISDIKANVQVTYEIEICPKTSRSRAINILMKTDDDELPEVVKMIKNHQELKKLEEFNNQLFDCQVCFAEKAGKHCLQFAGRDSSLRESLEISRDF